MREKPALKIPVELIVIFIVAVICIVIATILIYINREAVGRWLTLKIIRGLFGNWI
ncbi:MAG: hypothetical protein J5959_02835 [Butyrivibrio sp.]|nr:hypothetical protein [Butyrivibrio sp.]